MMSTQTFLVIGATGKTGPNKVQHLLCRGHAVRAKVRKEGERWEALRRTGAEVVIGELLAHDDVRRSDCPHPSDILLGMAVVPVFALDYCRKWHHRSAVWQRTPCSNRCGGPGARYRDYPGGAGRSCREDIYPLRTD